MTPQEARSELARRELARREVGRRQTARQEFATQHPGTSPLLERQQATLEVEEPLGTADFFPQTRQAVRQPLDLTRPGILPTDKVLGSAALDLLNVARVPVDVAIQQAQRAGSRPLQSPLDAIRSAVRQPEETLGTTGQPSRLDPFMREVSQTLVLGSPTARQLVPVARGIAEAVEVTPLLNPMRLLRKKPLTAERLKGMAPRQVGKLPPLERQAYFRLQEQQAQQAQLAQRQALKIQTQQTLQDLRVQQQALGRQAPTVAATRLEALPPSFQKLAEAKGKLYTQDMNTALVNAEQATGAPITVTWEDLSQWIANRYLPESRFGGRPEALLEDAQHYREMMNLLRKREIVNRQEIGARQLLDIADEVYQEVGVAAKQKARAMTPREVVAQHLRDALLDLLEKRGIDVRQPKADWAEWVPVRNLGLKLQTPSGPSTLIRIARGKDPVRERHLRSLETLLGEPLDQETKALFGQLDTLRQQEVLTKAQGVEREHLLARQAGLAKESRLGQKLAVEQQARKRKRVKQAVYATALLTLSQTEAGKALLRNLISVVNPLD